MTALRIGSVCTGTGGLDMAAAAVLGGELAWVAEHEPATEKNPRPRQAAARLLAHRYPDVPNHGDLTSMEWWQAEPIDLFTAGWPCQPFSVAGRRRGANDERAIWPYVARAIRDLRPRLVFLENVSAVVPDGELARAVGDLAALGYVGSWRCLRASDVGAPHRRERVFILASAADPERDGRAGWDPRGTREADARRDRSRAAAARRCAHAAADARGEAVGVGSGLRAGGARGVGWGRPDDGAVAATPDPDDPRREGPQPAGRRDVPAGRAVPDAAGDGRAARRTGDDDVLRLAHASERGLCALPERSDDEVDRQFGERTRRLVELGRPRRPAAADANGDGLSRRAERDVGPEAGQRAPLGDDAAGRLLDWGPYGPAVARWANLIGRPAPAPTQVGARGGQQLSPAFVEWMMGLPEGWVSDVPGLTRNDALKLLGNGVVPQQAIAALHALGAPS